MSTTQLNIGMNRGKPRLWIEGAFMAASGFVHGEPVTIKMYAGAITICADSSGKRKVCGTPTRPLFDISGNKLANAGFVAGTRVVLETNGDKSIIVELLK